MKIKTSELTGPALDWAVAKCAGEEVFMDAGELEVLGYSQWTTDGYKPSTLWAQGGPIIEREFITIMALEDGGWTASVGELWVAEEGGICGPTPLIAAMRCYVTSKLGDEVETPEELK